MPVRAHDLTGTWMADQYKSHPVTLVWLKIMAAKKQDTLQSFLGIDATTDAAAQVARRQGYIDGMTFALLALEAACKQADKEYNKDE